MMDYVLKLILNGLQNSTCLYHLSEKKLLLHLFKILEINQNEEDIFLLIVCILRLIVSHSNFYLEKGIDIFNETFKPLIIDVLLNGFQKFISNIKLLTEIILLISALSQTEGKYLEYLKTSNALSESIKICLDFHAENKTNIAVLTECMANLPVEEFNIIL